ncbi:MAG: F0F1 ATP synthase subunit alpha, partial [Bartonella sp.]|nr:F0F1 ATP synthase subunit alpha [Bartonella sp.]
QFSPLKTEEQVVVIFAGVNGYLDALAVSDVGRFEQGLLTLLRSDHQDILQAIANQKQITDDIKDKLIAVLNTYAKNFS